MYYIDNLNYAVVINMYTLELVFKAGINYIPRKSQDVYRSLTSDFKLVIFHLSGDDKKSIYSQTNESL